MELATNERLESITLVTGETFSIADKEFVTRKPKGFTTGHDDSLACSHRDLSVCDGCESRYANIVNIYSTCYWVRDYAEWLELVNELAHSALIY